MDGVPPPCTWGREGRVVGIAGFQARPRPSVALFSLTLRIKQCGGEQTSNEQQVPGVHVAGCAAGVCWELAKLA